MDFGKMFHSVEDAVYEIMVWILLLPKTLIRATLSPRATMNYVDEQWKIEKSEDRFDEYLSPVLLWLISVVIPWTYLLITSTDNTKFNEENVLKVTLYSMIIPFVYISWVEMLNKEPVKRSALKRAFYKHCYALTPSFLLTIIFGVTAILLSGWAYLLLIPAFFALPVYEAFVLEAELALNYKQAFSRTLVPQLILVLIALPIGLASMF